MFLQFVTARKTEPLPQPDPKYAQVGDIPKEVTQAVAAFMLNGKKLQLLGTWEKQHLGQLNG